MSVIVATKNGKRRTFSEQSWKLLGTNKEGWTAIPETEITNIAKTAPRTPPATGSKPAAAVKEQPIRNVTPASQEQSITDTTNTTEPASSTAPAVSDEAKEVFRKAAEGVNAGIIKDFFDARDPKVEYKKSAKKEALIDLLGDTIGWNVSEFQRLFS